MEKFDAEAAVAGLEHRLEVVETRLGIDPVAIAADAAASQVAGADAHVGNPQSDVASPVVPDSSEDALAAASAAVDEGETQQALDHVNRALERWPEDADLVAAKADLEVEVAKEQEAAAGGTPDQS